MRVQIRKRRECAGRYRVRETYLNPLEWHEFDLTEDELAELERQGAVEIREAPEVEDDDPGVYTIEELAAFKVPELREIAEELGLEVAANAKKDDLIAAIAAAEASAE